MLRTVIQAVIQTLLRRFDRRYDYDSAYLLALHDASPQVFRRFARLSGAATYRRAAPVEAYFATKLAAALAEDCGPCSQLCIEMAREADVPDDQIRAVVLGDAERMSVDTRLGWRFARVADGTAADGDAVRGEILERWGDAALAELALCATTSRMFPHMKRALGADESCRLLRVGADAGLRPTQP